MTDRPRNYDVLNIFLKFHAFPGEVDGKYCLAECLVPVGAGAPPNSHAGETEAFYVIDGQLGFMVDGREFVAGPGDFVPIPDGAAHAFQAVGEGPARVLILNAPGHMHEKFFTGIGSPLPDDHEGLPEPSEPNIPAITATADAVGMKLLAPA